MLDASLCCAGLLALGDFHNVSTQHDVPQNTNNSSSGSSGPDSSATSSAGSDAGQACPANLSEPAQKAAQVVPEAAAPPPAESAEGLPDLQLAHELALSCYELYRRTPAGLAPEIAHFANNSGGRRAGRRHGRGLFAALCLPFAQRCMTCLCGGRGGRPSHA